jgi:hypothetical protein
LEAYNATIRFCPLRLLQSKLLGVGLFWQRKVMGVVAFQVSKSAKKSNQSAIIQQSPDADT